jgi:hypothetical protein
MFKQKHSGRKLSKEEVKKKGQEIERIVCDVRNIDFETKSQLYAAKNPLRVYHA